MDKMKLAFQDSVQETVGRNIKELKFSRTHAFIGKRIPEEIRMLPNGNQLHVYDYWKGINIVVNDKCAVFLEFDKETMNVVSARSEGQGCYTAY